MLHEDFRGDSRDCIGQSSNTHSVDQVYVIDDDLQIRRSLHFVLATAGFTSWPFANASDFLDSLPTLKPAPILIDVRMPNISGIELMAMLVEKGIKWPMIVMTAHGDIPPAVKAIKLGALEFLQKPFDFELLESALVSAVATMSTSKIVDEVRGNADRLFGLLTRREKDVMSLLVQGLPNKIAAHQLSLSVRTVEMHRSNALLKLNVKTIAEVVHLASKADNAFDSFLSN